MNNGVKILITRYVPPEKEAAALPLIHALHTMAMQQPGYLSGEALRNLDDPNETLIISFWSSLADWENWVSSPKRADLQGRISEVLGDETRYKIYQYR